MTSIDYLTNMNQNKKFDTVNLKNAIVISYLLVALLGSRMTKQLRVI
jgi:hypothetical protein